VFFLGTTMAVQASFSALNGVLTGCHQWGLHNINSSGWYVATVTGMVVAMLLGGGLRSLGAINLAGEILASARRAVLARRVCPALQVRPSLVQWSMIKKQFVFGGKTLIPSVSNLLLNQTTSVLLLAYLGPVALAVFNRPRSLIHHVNMLVNKMAMTLTPTTSSLQSMGDGRAIQDLTIKAAQYALYVSLPMVLTLVIYGGPIIQFWMGPRYGGNLVPAILAAGYLAVLVQQPALSILAGLNAHGRAGVARLVASLCSVGLNIVALKYLGWGLVGTAVAVTLPLAVLNVVDIPLLICRRVGLGARRYYASVIVSPVVHTLPLAICLVAARLAFHTRPLIGLGLGGVVGGGILGVIYWRNVLPDRMRTKISGGIRSKGQQARSLVFGK